MADEKVILSVEAVAKGFDKVNTDIKALVTSMKSLSTEGAKRFLDTAALDKYGQKIKQVSQDFNNYFVKGLEGGKRSGAAFGKILTDIAGQSNMASSSFQQMAGASGLFSKSMMNNAYAYTALAQKADVLTRAVNAGTMSARDAGKEFGSFANQLKASSSGIGDFLGGLKGIALTIGGAVAAVAAFGMAWKAAFDFSAQGAAFSQIQESFRGYMDQIGAAPGLMDDLRHAARGTVDDMSLMGGTLTMVAGQSDEMSKSIVEAAPKLLEIAKAANKLNPALGSVTYMYESLVTGIKRSSPRLIDNTGLYIKLAEANEILAKSLGKNVQELTAEEQKLALLNATLEAGAQLIRQSGGDVSSLTDEFNALGAAWTNTKNAFAEGLTLSLGSMGGGGLTGFLNDLTDTRTLSNTFMKVKEALNQAFKGGFIDETQFRAMSDELNDALLNAVPGTDAFADAQTRVAKIGDAVIKVMSDEAVYAEKEATFAQNAADAAKKKAEAYKEQTQASKDLHEEQRYDKEHAADLRSIEVDATRAAAAEQRLADAARLLSYALSRDMKDAITSYTTQMDSLESETDKLVKKFYELREEGGTKNKEKMQELSAQINANEDAMEALNAEIEETTAAIVFQAAVANADAEVQLELAHSLGMVSEADYALGLAMEAVNKQFDASGDGIINAKEAASGYLDMVSAVQMAMEEFAKEGITDFNVEELLTRAAELYNNGLREITGGFGALGEEEKGGGAPLLDVELISDESLTKIDEAKGKIEEITQLSLDEMATSFERTSDAALGMQDLSLAIDQINLGLPTMLALMPELNAQLGALTTEGTNALRIMVGLAAAMKMAAGAALALANAAKAAAAALAALPSKKEVTLIIRTIYITEFQESGKPGHPSLGGPGNWNVEWAGGGGPNQMAAQGANFVVPPGYPNDSFLVGVTSGEQVVVDPSPGGKSNPFSQGGSSPGLVVYQNIQPSRGINPLSLANYLLSDMARRASVAGVSGMRMTGS